MQTRNDADELTKLIRLAIAAAGYRYPEYANFNSDLQSIIDEPAPDKWLIAGKVLKHMHHDLRVELFELRNILPKIFPSVDTFTMMLCCYIPENDIADLALQYIPILRNDHEYQSLLSAIPEDDVAEFQQSASSHLTFKSKFSKQKQEEIAPASPVYAYWQPLTLLASLAAYYLHDHKFSLAWPILGSLCSLYLSLRNHKLRTPQTITFTSLWQKPAASQNDVKINYNNYLSHQ